MLKMTYLLTECSKINNDNVTFASRSKLELSYSLNF